jgi:hypothetical protein
MPIYRFKYDDQGSTNNNVRKYKLAFIQDDDDYEIQTSSNDKSSLKVKLFLIEPQNYPPGGYNAIFMIPSKFIKRSGKIDDVLTLYMNEVKVEFNGDFYDSKSLKKLINRISKKCVVDLKGDFSVVIR